MTPKQSPRTIQIFISSPSDVGEARDTTERIIEEIDAALGAFLGIRLVALRWEADVAPRMGRPQSVVLDQLSVDAVDIFIGILWQRFGTPTGATNPNTGLPYSSGTEEEFREAYQAWEARGLPHIMFYRCNEPPKKMTDLDPQQLSLVDGFFKEFSHAGQNPGFVRTYSSLTSFSTMLRQDLLHILRLLVPSSNLSEGTSLGPEHTQYGFSALFLQSQNDLRNDAKRRALLEARQVRLLAQNGHSYVALHGHRFREELETLLDAGGRFEAAIMNPWTQAGYQLSALYEGFPHPPSDPKPVAAADAVSIIKSSTSYRVSLANVIAGYRGLKKKYGERVHIVVSDQAPQATILLTEKVGFFEPYLMSSISERMNKHMNTFDVQISDESYLYHYASELLDVTLSSSISLEDFMENEERIISEFSARHGDGI